MDKNFLERRKNEQDNRDMLIRIDANLTALLNSFASHIADDKEIFKEQNRKLEFLQSGYWMTIGAIVVVELVFKFFIR